MKKSVSYSTMPRALRGALSRPTMPRLRTIGYPLNKLEDTRFDIEQLYSVQGVDINGLLPLKFLQYSVSVAAVDLYRGCGSLDVGKLLSIAQHHKLFCPNKCRKCLRD